VAVENRERDERDMKEGRDIIRDFFSPKRKRHHGDKQKLLGH